MDAVKFEKAVRVIGRMASSAPEVILPFAVMDGEVSEHDGWVKAAMGCASPADMVSIACEFLLADCREGYRAEIGEGE